MLGQRIGNYRIVAQIAKGGMGVIYEGVHERIDKHVAIKVLLRHFAHDAHLSARFFNEARAIAAIGHPGIVEIYDFGQTESGTPYIVMEYLRGETLSRRLRRERTLSPPLALRFARQMASALSAAHTHKIVHRDLKPGNVFLVTDPEALGKERAKILDFGIAKMAEEVLAEDDEELHTRTGMLLGTPAYMAPEQCRGAGQVDERADVYALGVMLYQMLLGRPPFVAEGDGEVLAMQIYERPRPVRDIDPSISPEVARLVERMLAKQAAGRPSMQQVAEALEHLGIKLSGVLSAAVAMPSELPPPSLPGAGGAETRLMRSGALAAPTVVQPEPLPPAPEGRVPSLLTPLPAPLTPLPRPAQTAPQPTTTTRHGAGEQVSLGERRKAAPLLLYLLGTSAAAGIGILVLSGLPWTHPDGPGGPRSEGPPSVVAVPLDMAAHAGIGPGALGEEAEPSLGAASPARERVRQRSAEREAEPVRHPIRPHLLAQRADAPPSAPADAPPSAEAAPAIAPVPAPDLRRPEPAGPPPERSDRADRSQKPKNIAAHVIDRDKLSGPMPHLPPAIKALHRSQGSLSASYQLCIDASGRVTQVRRLDNALPEAEQAIGETLRTWIYKAQGIPLCFVENFTFELE